MKKKIFALILAILMLIPVTSCSLINNTDKQDEPAQETTEPVDMVAELGLTKEPKWASTYTGEINSVAVGKLPK